MKAMILAAGSGTRLLPLTHLRPKPLFPVYTVPLLGLITNQLRETSIKDIIINTHHLSQKVDSYIQENTPSGMTITLSHEPELLGTGGAIKKVEEFWDDQPFLVINGDIIHTIDLHLAYQHHIKSENTATLILHHYPLYNQVEIDQEGTIVGIREKRVKETSSPTRQLAFTGIHIISPRLLREIPPDCHADIISLYLKLISRGMKLGGYQAEDHYWLDIGTPSDYHRIHQDIHQKKVKLNQPFPEAVSSSIGKNSVLDGYVCMGENTTVGKNCMLRNSILWDGVEIQDNLTIEGCIIGDDVKVKQSIKNQVVVS
jgi:mannose-1-phosphate guanylyltransferase